MYFSVQPKNFLKFAFVIIRSVFLSVRQWQTRAIISSPMFEDIAIYGILYRANTAFQMLFAALKEHHN
jgi:hypothetical protein